MNILFVWTSPFKDGGGVGRVTTTLGEEFVKRGHNVYYFSFSEGNEYKINGISQLFVPVKDKPLADGNVQYLKQIIKEKDINIVINQVGISNSDVLRSINRAKNALIPNRKLKIFSVHHNCIKCLYKHFELVLKDNYKSHWLSPIVSNKLVLKLLKARHKQKYQRILNYLIEKSDYLVLLSDQYKPDLKTYLKKVPDEEVIGIANPAPFGVKNVEHLKENRLLFVGRVNFQQKRTDLLIEVWERLHKKYSEWEFDVVGDGEALESLKKRASLSNLDRIHFHGFQDPVPYLEKAKFFVMTSAFEGFPMVIVEAQAYGVVPVAFNSFSSLSDIVTDNENGLAIKPFDIDAFANRLGEVMTDEKKRIGMASCARDSVTNFYPFRIAEKWEQVFTD